MSRACTVRSPEPGTTIWGTPAASAVITVPAPPWWTIPATCGRTSANGSQSVVVTFGGSGRREPARSGRTSTTSTSAPSAAATTEVISRSGRGSATVDRLTRIIGRPSGRVNAAGTSPWPPAGT